MTVRRTLRSALVLLVAAFTLSLGSVAGAVDNPDYTAPSPSTPVRVVPTRVAAVRAKPAVADPAKAANQRLAITGSETLQLVVVGAVLLVGGAGLMVVRRRSANL